MNISKPLFIWAVQIKSILSSSNSWSSEHKLHFPFELLLLIDCTLATECTTQRASIYGKETVPAYMAEQERKFNTFFLSGNQKQLKWIIYVSPQSMKNETFQFSCWWSLWKNTVKLYSSLNSASFTACCGYHIVLYFIFISLRNNDGGHCRITAEYSKLRSSHICM